MRWREVGMRIRETQTGITNRNNTDYSHNSGKSSAATYSVKGATKGRGRMMSRTLQVMPRGQTFISAVINSFKNTEYTYSESTTMPES